MFGLAMEDLRNEFSRPFFYFPGMSRHCVVSIVLMISDSGLNVLETSSGLGFFDVFHGDDPDGLDFFYFSRHVRRELGGASYECRFLKLEDFIGSCFPFRRHEF